MSTEREQFIVDLKELIDHRLSVLATLVLIREAVSANRMNMDDPQVVELTSVIAVRKMRKEGKA